MVEVNLSKCRWMLFTKNNKLITENHNQNVTWKPTYKHEHGNMKALCFQLIPSGKKVFVAESPYEEYWTSDEFHIAAGQTVPTHDYRVIASLKDKELGLWDTVRIDARGRVVKAVMSTQEIGYETRRFLNKNELERIRKYV